MTPSRFSYYDLNGLEIDRAAPPPSVTDSTATPMTSRDIPITDELVDRLAAEAELGYDPAKLKVRGRPRIGSGPSVIVPVRLDPVLPRRSKHAPPTSTRRRAT